jgi:phosphohistidine phosphatase
MDNDQVIQSSSSPKILYLLRHSDAENSFIKHSDFTRKLSQYGREKARTFSSNFASEINVDLIFCSNAIRTKETLRLLELQEIDSKFSDTLYLAQKEVLITEIQNVSKKINKLLVVGHNNGLSDFLHYLTGSKMLLATCQMVEIQIETDDWALIGQDTGSLLRNFF